MKIVSTLGSLILNPGADADGLAIDAEDDVLLQTLDPAGDIILNAGAAVNSVSGNVHINSADDVVLNANVTAQGSVRIVALNGTNNAGNNGIDVNATITGNDDVQLETTADIRLLTAQSTGGGLGLFAGRDVIQNVNLQAVGNVAINAGRDYLMAGGTSTIASGVSFAIAGRDIDLSFHQALQVALRATGDISDVNGAANNIRANTLSLFAGGLIGDADALNGTPNLNANAIEIQLGRMIATEAGLLAASAGSGIYLQDLSASGAIVVSTIAALSVSNTAQTVNFNSTRTPNVRTNSQTAIEDLRTTAGPIKLVMLDGSLTINSGADATAISTGGGDLLLDARSAGSDLTISAGAVVNTAGGHATLKAVDQVQLLGTIQTAAGSVYSTGTNIALQGSINTTTGNVALISDQTLSVSASGSITSTSGDIRLVSTNANVTLDGSVSTAGNVGVNANGSVSMTTGSISNANTIIVVTGTDMTLGSLAANAVNLRSGGSILDGNGAVLNVESDTLSMQATNSIGNSDIFNLPLPMSTRSI